MKTSPGLLLIALLIFSVAGNAAPPAEDGKAIFSTRCAACHNINKKLTGPALAGVHERRSVDWIIKFVNSSQTLIKSGDKDAVALFEQFNKVPMPDHPDLTADNIKSIIEYIKTESVPVATNTKIKSPKKGPFYTPFSVKDYGFFIAFGIVVVMLIMTLYFAVLSKSYSKQGRNFLPS